MADRLEFGKGLPEESLRLWPSLHRLARCVSLASWKLEGKTAMAREARCGLIGVV